MRSKRIQVKVSVELLKDIDEAAQKNRNSRSGFIRESLVLRLRGQHVVQEPKPHEVLELLKQAK